MSSWTTITIATNPELPSGPDRYAYALTEPLEYGDYRESEDGDEAVVTVYVDGVIEDCLDALFHEYGNSYLCPGAVVIEAENTGESRTARIVRPTDDELGEWEVVGEYEWIDREDEGEEGVRDSDMEALIEDEHGISAETVRYRHHVA